MFIRIEHLITGHAAHHINIATTTTLSILYSSVWQCPVVVQYRPNPTDQKGSCDIADHAWL